LSLNAEDRQIAPEMVISADNDEAATEQAEQMLDGVRAELRDWDRLVMRPSKKVRRLGAAPMFALSCYAL
jgi:phosphomannomutase